MSSKEIIESGLLELYALGALEGSELAAVISALASDEELRKELEQVEHTLFLYAQANAIVPGPTVRPFLMAKVDYVERLKNGEVPDEVPVLNENSRIEDFDRWINRSDMQLRQDFADGQVNIISVDPDKVTAIVWLKLGSPQETHNGEYEKFLIIEGTCNLTIDQEVHRLQSGDYLTIPLHVSHHVRVTSQIPCKFILQRVKA